MKRLLPFALLLTGAFCDAAALAAEDLSNWFSFAGNGSFCPPVEGVAMFSDPAQARTGWRLSHHTGVQKTNAVRDGEFYGGTACVIAAEGMVFTSFIRPAGEVLNEKRTNRYYPIGKQPRTVRQIDADDVTIAVDACSGKLLWETAEKSVSLNFLFGKRGHYGITPAYGHGMVFSWGALGRIYAYDAKSGVKKWEATAEAFHAKAAEEKHKALAAKNIPDTYGGARLFEDQRTGLLVVEGALAAPDGFEGLIGFDATSGRKLWELPKVISRGATPALWRDGGKAYLLCPFGRQNEGKISLIAPADGKVLWSFAHQGPAHTSLVVGGDKVFFNTRGNILNGVKGPRGDKREGSGLLGCYQLTVQGPRELWKFEDKEENWHAIRPDRGMNRRIAIRDGIGYLLLGERQKLVAVELATGKVIQRDTAELPGTACSPLLIEDRLVFPLDVAHSWGGVKLAAYSLKKGGGFERLGDIDVERSLMLEIVTDYEVGNEFAAWKGRLFAKTREGLACIDLRRP